MVPGVQTLVAHDRHLRLVADSPVPSVISDPRLPDNPIVACNSAFCDLTGYSTEEVIGRNCRFLSGPGTEPWLTEEIRRGVREHQPVLVETSTTSETDSRFATLSWSRRFTTSMMLFYISWVRRLKSTATRRPRRA